MRGVSRSCWSPRARGPAGCVNPVGVKVAVRRLQRMERVVRKKPVARCGAGGSEYFIWPGLPRRRRRRPRRF
eukprot:1487972-Lingulodinium_polyedra.AAC.1